MNSRHIVPVVALALAAALTPLAAHAGAPPEGGRHAELTHHCKGGPKKGQVCDASAANQSCTQDSDCDTGAGEGCFLKAGQCSECGNSECAFDFPGKAHSALLTVVMDDDVSDPGDDTSVTLHALTVMLEVSNGNDKRILAETYANAQAEEINMGIWNSAIEENNLVVENPESFLFQIPNGTLAEALRQYFGETGVPLVVSAASKADASSNQGSLSCKTAGVPYQCCTGASIGTCSGRNAQCVAFGNPFSCCRAAGKGTCDIEQVGSTYRVKVKLRFAAP